MKKENSGRHKFFFWLLVLDRLSTRNLLRRKNFCLRSYSCVLCNANVDSLMLKRLWITCSLNALSVLGAGALLGSLGIIRETAGSQSSFGLAHLYENCHFDSLVYLVNEEQSHL